MIQYPAGLPCFERSNYGLQTVDPQLRTELESGRQRVRRKFTATPTSAECSVVMDDAQAQVFEAWWEETLVSGTKYFEAPLKTPMGMQSYTCRFLGIYQGPVLVGVSHWRFTFTLELRKRPILPPGWVEHMPDFILYSSRFDRLMNQTWPEAINGDTP